MNLTLTPISDNGLFVPYLYRLFVVYRYSSYQVFTVEPELCSTKIGYQDRIPGRKRRRQIYVTYVLFTRTLF